MTNTRRAGLILGCWMLLLTFSFLQYPIPAVNEPHYLAKSLHYWNPAWCARDLLMASADAHVVFFAVFGGLASWLGFAATAVIGRLLTLLLFAAAWVSLAGRLTRSTTAVLLAVPGFLCLNVAGTLAGEWIVGGVEGKVPAWGFALFAIRYAIDRRWIPFGVHAGLSVSFHPVVGAWLVLFTMVSEFIRILRGDPPWTDGRGRKLIWGALAGAACAAPGLIPALAVLTPPEVPPELAGEVRDAAHLRETADYVQVFYRLRHHMDPVDFDREAWLIYGGLGMAWLLLSLRRGLDSVQLHLILGASVVLVVVSAWLGWGPRPALGMEGYAWKAKLLKLYPFRFADALLPMVVSLQLTVWISEATRRHEWIRGATGAVLVAIALLVPAQAPITDRPENRADWLAACQWVSENTDVDDLLVTPREARDFKWYAQRAEYVNFKDCPQDAPGIVEWNRRLWQLREWRQASIVDGEYSTQELTQLGEFSGAGYLLTKRTDRFENAPLYENDTYRIFSLTPPPQP